MANIPGLNEDDIKTHHRPDDKRKSEDDIKPDDDTEFNDDIKSDDDTQADDKDDSEEEEET